MILMTLALLCDGEQPFGCEESTIVAKRPLGNGEEETIFLLVVPGWAPWEEQNGKWFCPACAQRIKEAKPAPSGRRVVAKAPPLVASPVAMPQMPMAAPVQVLAPVAPQQANAAPLPPVLAPAQPAPARPLTIPAGSPHQTGNTTALVVPAQNGNAPVMAPAGVVVPAQPNSAPAQVIAAQGGDAPRVPLDQMPVRFEPPPR